MVYTRAIGVLQRRIIITRENQESHQNKEGETSKLLVGKCQSKRALKLGSTSSLLEVAMPEREGFRTAEPLQV